MSTRETKVPSVPTPTNDNLLDVARAIKGVLDVREGKSGDDLDAFVKKRDLLDPLFKSVYAVGGGGSGGGVAGPPGPPGPPSAGPPPPDLTPPPQPTGFAVTAGLTSLFLNWDVFPSGYAANHAYTEIWRADTNVLGNAIMVATAAEATTMYVDAVGRTGAGYFYWIRFRSIADVPGPYNSTDGTQGTTGRIGNVDLGPLIVEAGNLANGSVSGTKLADAAVSMTKFAAGIRPPRVVSSLPASPFTGYAAGDTVVLTTDNVLYRFTGTGWTAAVDGALISAGTLGMTSFASGIRPPRVVAALPASPWTGYALGDTVVLTTDNKLYRFTGSGWTRAVDGGDITANTITTGSIAAGAVAADQIAAGAIRAQHVLIAPKSLNTDPGFVAGAARWTGFVRRLPRTDPAVPAGCPASHAAEFNVRDGWSSTETMIDVVPGERYRASCWVNRGTGSGGLGIGVVASLVQADGTTTFFVWPGTPTTASGWVRVTGVYTVTANGARLRFGVWADRAAYTGEAWYADLSVEKMNDASLIVDGAITAGKLDVGAVTAGTIAAGAVSASEIAAGAIRAQHLLIAPKSLNPDPSFSAGLARWSGFVRRLARTDPAVPANCPSSHASEFNIRDGSWSYEDIPVVEGEQYRISCWVSGGSTGAGAIGVLFFGVTASGSVTTTPVFSVAASSGWQRVSGVYSVPATIVRLRPGAWADRAAYTGASWYADLEVEKLNDASLIVNGAITANKIAANAIAVGTAAIQNGAIVNAMIGDATIEDAKINTLNVSKLTTGSLAVGQELRSTDYSPGPTGAGWRIARQAAEFNFVNVRGTLLANQVAANFVTANMLAANSINARHITVSDFENLVTNGRGASTDGWSATGGQIGAVSGFTFWPASYGSQTALECWGRDQNFGSPIPVREGDSFFLSWDSLPAGGLDMAWLTRFGLFLFNSAGAVITQATGIADRAAATSGNQRISGFYTVPATVGGQVVAAIQPWIQVDKPGGNTSRAARDAIFVTNVILRRRTGGELIVDGAVTANKLTIGARGVPTLVPNADFTDWTGTNSGIAALRGWAVWNFTPAGAAIGRNWDSGRAWNIGRGGAWIYDAATNQGTSDHQWGIVSSRVAVSAGIGYEFHVKGAAHRCNFRAFITWRDGSGNYIADTFVGELNAGTSIVGSMTTLQQAIWGGRDAAGNANIVAPSTALGFTANAAFAEILLLKSPSLLAGSDSYVFFQEVYFNILQPGASAINPSQFRGTDVVEIHGGGITANTITANSMSALSISTEALQIGSAGDTIGGTFGSAGVTINSQGTFLSPVSLYTSTFSRYNSATRSSTAVIQYLGTLRMTTGTSGFSIDWHRLRARLVFRCGPYQQVYWSDAIMYAWANGEVHIPISVQIAILRNESYTGQLTLTVDGFIEASNPGIGGGAQQPVWSTAGNATFFFGRVLCYDWRI